MKTKFDFVFIVKKGEKYLADRFFHNAWTATLIRAKKFLTLSDAIIAAERNEAKVWLMQLTEVEEAEETT